MMLFPPMVVQTQKITPLRDAVAQMLENFDAEDPSIKPSDPRVAPKDRLSLRWLRNAARNDFPENPFTLKSASHAEAEGLRALLRAPEDQRSALLSKLTLKESGTALALWRWARRCDRAGGMRPMVRHATEDLLLSKNIPNLLQGYALRHALCWALAENDEARFAALKSKWGEDAASMIQGFQSLFAILGSPSPELRLWEIPTLQYRDLRLGSLKAANGSIARRIWICPVEGDLPKIPADTAWIVPTSQGQMNIEDSSLTGASLKEGEALGARLAPGHGHAYLAPSENAFSAVGLTFFPILIELDDKGAIQRIRMGDAAPSKP